MFRIESFDYIVKFNTFLEMRYYVKLKNIKMFLFRPFIQESVLAKNVFQNIYSKQCIF